MNHLAGALLLVRDIVRRDRLRLVLWIAGIVALVVVTVGSTKGLYTTQAQLDEAAGAARDNPAALAFNGPDVALDTIGGQVAFQIGAVGLTFVGLMCLLLVVRFTRADEAGGRLELVRATPVGRHAPLAAALVVVGGTALVVGMLTTVVLILSDLPVAGSIVLGASYVALGLVFAGIAAVTAQVTENPRVASGLAGAALGGSFLVRAVGDGGSGALSWASPIGWAQKARPYGGDVVWPLALCVLAAVALMLLARWLEARRDFAAGLVAPRPGPARAAPGLRSPLALAFRLQRGAVLWWTVSVVAMAVAWGSLANSIEEFTKDNESLQDVLARSGSASVTDGYLSTTLLFSALIAGGAALQMVTRLRTEETEHRGDIVLATPVTRSGWAGGHLAAAFTGSGLAVVAGGLGLGATYGLVVGDAGQVPRLVGASLLYLPPVWLLAGLAVALFGAAPRWVAAAWGVWAACLVLGLFGTLIDIPEAVRDISPFEAVPALPAESMRLVPVVLVAAVTVALVATGITTLRRRDLG